MYADFGGMFLICVHMKFLMSSSSGPLLMAVKLKTEHVLHSPAILFYSCLNVTLKFSRFSEIYFHV